MSDPLLDLADGVVALINEHTWGETAPTFTAERHFLPVIDLERETPGTTKVRVVPVSDLVRGKACVRGEDLVRVFIQQKLPERIDDATDDANVSAMLSFAGDMRTFLLLTPVALSGRNLWCAEAARRPAYDMDLLHAKREFFAAIVGTWKSFSAAVAP